jgi:hypothetical protein
LNPVEMIASIQYKLTGIQRILSYKTAFEPEVLSNRNNTPKKRISKEIAEFINLFCEYQLADNNYMDLQIKARQYRTNLQEWYNSLTIDEVLKSLTYIIWTDKFVENYLASRIEDSSVYFLLSRLDLLQSELILPVTSN